MSLERLDDGRAGFNGRASRKVHSIGTQHSTQRVSGILISSTCEFLFVRDKWNGSVIPGRRQLFTQALGLDSSALTHARSRAVARR